MAFTLPKLSLPKLNASKPAAPSLTQDKKRLPLIVGGLVVVAAGAWFGWQYLMEEPPPPPAPPKPAATAAAPKKLTPEEIAKARDKLVADVLAATGLKDQLEELPRKLANSARGGEQSAKKPANARVGAAKAALAEALAARDFAGAFAEDLSKNGDDKQLQAALKEFSAPAGRRALELARTPQAADALAKFAHANAVTPPPPERIALLRRIDAATRGGDFAMEAATATLRTLLPALAAGNAKKADAMEKFIDKQLAAAESKIRADALTGTAFGLKDASDAELAKIAEVYEKPASKWLYGRLYDVALKQMTSAGEEAVADLAKREPAAKLRPAHAAGRKPSGDARRCLDLASNAEIMRCAEAYR